MSILVRKQRKRGKHPRWNHKNYHLAHRIKRKRHILKNSGWKLEYPEIFKLIEDFPYIVRRHKEESLTINTKSATQ